MRILVTGGSGFLGSHLCDYLLEREHKVVCIDNFLTGSHKNIAHLLSNSNFILIKHDIINPLFLDDQVDQIYNLACPASPVHYQSNAIRTIKANTIGVINMLGLAVAKRARFFQASTSEVYGDPLIHPQVESYWGNVNTIGERACYDEGKRVAETLCFDYKRQRGVEIRVARIFNTYGPRMARDDGRVVSNFIIQALENKDVTIYGDGSQTRSFCYVDDLVEGFYGMMNFENLNGPVNLGNPGEFTMLELAQKVILKTNSRSKIVHKILPQDDPKMRKPDITLANSKFGWQPKIDLDEGLDKTIAYFAKILESKSRG